MLLTTACLPVLLTILNADEVTAQHSQFEGLWPQTTTQVLALKPTDGSLPSADKSRSKFEWTPRGKERRWVYIVIHHSATTQGSVEAIHNEHSQRKDSFGNNWLGIGYHFVIGNGKGMPDGEIEPTFRWRTQIHGAHSGSAVHNANGIGICMIGNFQKQPPTGKQIESLEKLIGQLARRYNIPPRLVIGHNKVKPTECPGSLLPLGNIIEKAVKSPTAAKPGQHI